MKIADRTIELDAAELSQAIEAYLQARDVIIDGSYVMSVSIRSVDARDTIKLATHPVRDASMNVYVNPDGRVLIKEKDDFSLVVIERESLG